MSAVVKKPHMMTPETRALSKGSPITSPSRNSNRSSSSSPSTTVVSSVARSRSARLAALNSSRAGIQRVGAGTDAVKMNSVTPSSEADDNSREADNATLNDLRERLQKSEELSEESTRQIQVLQKQLEKALQEKKSFEERVHESEEYINTLENEKREAIRMKREIEAIYEAEKVSMTKEREDSANREEEMQTVIQRLRDTLDSQVDEDERHSRQSKQNSTNLEQGQFASPSCITRSDSQNNSKLLLMKDRLIESLRIELAESQIKIVESENMGGGRFHAIEKQLLEARMTNAKLMEENESYQLLLSEKKSSVDLPKSDSTLTPSHNTDALNALEGRTDLENLVQKSSQSEDNHHGAYSRLEAELKVFKEKNKALQAYINNILDHRVKDLDSEVAHDISSESQLNMNLLDKELPVPPKEVNGIHVLQRAKTVALGASRRPRPQSYMPHPNQSLVTDQETAPSIPLNLNRSGSYRINRPQSEQFTGGTITTLNQTLRGGHSPTLHIPHSPHPNQSFFVPPTPGVNPNAAHRNPSIGQTSIQSNYPGFRSENSSISGDSGENITTPSHSPPRVEKATTFAGNKPRPLRLLRETGPSESSRRAEDDLPAKFSKRSSWMGWAFGKKEDVHIDEILKES
ncbi:hypothetical protein GcM3_120009 [Golovinomyces cichoracearum]|uniref:M serotype protein n=1 Tax=Golovinomyces cichoracearum TaxID=62708 RepID=A0A420I733_9PEZI|nr:hypothetical protein GcM3_120009 [Golovinomyces cichoracearum]